MSKEDFSEYRAAVMLWKIIPPFLFIFGTIGNVLTIIVLLQKRLRKAPTSLFLASLGVSDMLALTTGLMRQWIKYTFHFDIREDLAVSGCKFHWFFVYIVTQFSSWMLVCVTIERVICSYLPHNRRLVSKKKFAYGLLCVIFCVLIALNGHFLFGYGNVQIHIGNETRIERCVPTTETYSYFILYSWTWIDLCVFYLIPMLVLLTGNSLVIYKVFESHRRACKSVAPNDNIPTKTIRQKTSSLTVLLMLISVMFFLCITPIVIYPIGEPYWKEGASQHKLAIMFLSETLANLFMYVNHSLNFVLYFLSGSKFRSEVKRLLFRSKLATSLSELRATMSRSQI